MSICPELRDFCDENDFVQRFLVPLLGRLGIGIVVNHHGMSEAGMDLIVGEIDRFGHVRYHGVQAKFTASIGKSDSHGLVQDAREAFAAEFRHPQTGAMHRISSFYAVNAGSISDEARAFFFSSLSPHYGDNVRLLEGRDAVALDRSAAARLDAVRDRLNGLLFEMRSIQRTIASVEPYLILIGGGDGNNVSYPLERLRIVAMQSWLAQPSSISALPVPPMEDLFGHCNSFNRALDDAGISPLHTVVSIKAPAMKALSLLARIRAEASEVEKCVLFALAPLGPLASL